MPCEAPGEAGGGQEKAALTLALTQPSLGCREPLGGTGNLQPEGWALPPAASWAPSECVESPGPTGWQSRLAVSCGALTVGSQAGTTASQAEPPRAARSPGFQVLTAPRSRPCLLQDLLSPPWASASRTPWPRPTHFPEASAWRLPQGPHPAPAPDRQTDRQTTGGAPSVPPGPGLPRPNWQQEAEDSVDPPPTAHTQGLLQPQLPAVSS